MKRLFLLVLLSFILKCEVKAQNFYRNEVGIFIGGSYYTGDLNPYKHFLQTKFAGGLLYRYNITPRWALKVTALIGGLEGSDTKSRANPDRNLSFRSYIFEFSPQIEFNFLQYIIGDKKHWITPYIFAGAALFTFQPQAQYESKWYNLNSLGTEGQGTTLDGAKKPYSLASVSLPFGIGVKMAPFNFLSLGLEWGIRKTFTDYIDDVSTVYPNPVVLASENGAVAAALSDRSLTAGNHAGLQRGNPSTKDWYVFTGLTATFRIKTKAAKCSAYKEHPKIRNRYKD
jgi:hypothetical protein